MLVFVCLLLRGAVIMSRSVYQYLYLVIGIHFGHHSFFQKIKGQHLQHIQLVRHLCFDWPISSYNVLVKRRIEVKSRVCTSQSRTLNHTALNKSGPETSKAKVR